MGRPTSIRIFLTDGTPDGIRIVEKANWTGRAVVASRAQLADALKQREELARPGVYVLTGTDDDGAPRLYIGEADDLAARLRTHASSKDFWTTFVAFTSTDQNLNKAHVRYLESRMVGLATAANQWQLENGNTPAEPPLSEADRADAEWFLDEMLLVFPTLGIDAFEPASTEHSVADDGGELYLSQRGCEGRGRETRDGFVVFAGSRARIKEGSSMHAYQRDLRRQLLERGVLATDGSHYVFTQDFRFNSPTMAAAALVGTRVNGRTAWRTCQGQTLKTIQTARGEGTS